MTEWYRVSNPLREAVTRYRNPETVRNDEILDAFLYFMETCTDATPEFRAEVKARIDEYLEYKIEDVQAGEAEMLRRWKVEVKPHKV